MQADISLEDRDGTLNLFPARKGHFKMESGHHGDLWLDLELLCLHPQRMNRLASELAKKLASHNIEMVCGPLIEGAFVGLKVASELNLEFTYTERFENPEKSGLYPVEYRLPGALRK